MELRQLYKIGEIIGRNQDGFMGFWTLITSQVSLFFFHLEETEIECCLCEPDYRELNAGIKLNFFLEA